MKDAADVSQAVVLAGILIANVGGLIGFFVSLKVAIARLEVKVDKLEIDVNNLGGKIKQKL